MDLAKLLRNSRTTRDCEISFIISTAVGSICFVTFYVSCLFEHQLPPGLFLAAMAYGIPGGVLSFFSASLYFARWSVLSNNGNVTSG